MGRRGTIWDLGAGPGGRISLRISPGGSRPLNLNFLLTILEPFFFHFTGFMSPWKPKLTLATNSEKHLAMQANSNSEIACKVQVVASHHAPLEKQ